MSHLDSRFKLFIAERRLSLLEGSQRFSFLFVCSSVCLSEITMKGGEWRSDFFGRVVQRMRLGYYVLF